MDLLKCIFYFTFLEFANSLVVKDSEEFQNNTDDNVIKIDSPDNVFNGVYTECFLHLSYSCLQKKTLLYLKELNNLSEVSVLGDYVKFVKVNTTILPIDDDDSDTGNTDELAFLIDKAVDAFFDTHILKFNALGRNISIPRNLDEFVGRKKRKGGGGGGGEGMMGGHGHDDKKKMMMMGMMCMKMKLMMMVPAMMGMMGMMSFKGMMFSMMSFMISKLMLLMKILEKKGGAGGLGGGGGGGDGGWAAAGGGGGAWMPAGGQDFGSGGGYDANGQWQSRSIAESLDIINKPTVYFTSMNNAEKYPKAFKFNKDDYRKDDILFKHNTELENSKFKAVPEISYVKPIVRFNNKMDADVYKKPVLVYKKSNVVFNSYGDENSESTDLRNEDEKNTDDLRAKRSVPKLKDEAFNQNNTDISKTRQDNEKFKQNFSEKTRNKKETPRKKRSLIDFLQNSYAYWMTKLLGINNNRRTNLQKYKIINGVRYVYYPFKAQKTKSPKGIQLTSQIKLADQVQPIITAEDFNKGEIMEGAVEARTLRKNFKEMKEEVSAVNDTIEDNPWA